MKTTKKSKNSKPVYVPGQHAHNRRLTKECAKTTNIAREASLAFYEADANQDGSLDFEEFKDAVKRMRRMDVTKDANKGGTVLDDRDEAQLFELFNSIDVDGSGTLTQDEYFLWALSVACEQGCGLEPIFRKYDTSGEGQLDASEFALAIEDLGFSGTFAQDLFIELDDDNSGSVSYKELTTTIKHKLSAISEQSKKLLTTLAFSEAKAWDEAEVTDINGHSHGFTASSLEKRIAAENWGSKLKGPDGNSFRKQLHDLLQGSALRDSDLYNMLVCPLVKYEGSRPLTKEVFVEGCRRLGYTGATGMLLSLYKRLDTDRSGVVGFSEIREWMTGRMNRVNLARRVHLLWGRTDGATLESLAYTPKNLKRELVLMLRRAELAPLDLVRAWDVSGDGSFSFREFLIMMKKIVFTGVVADSDGDAASAAEAKRKAAEFATHANTEAGFHWKLGGKASATTAATKNVNGSVVVTSLVMAARDKEDLEQQEKAATRVQAYIRGRRVRERTKLSRAEADKLWYDRIRPVVTMVFEYISGQDKTMDIEEFVRW